ncbi:hypothetical protein JHK87_015750 [Glycine soja]|nr:hypothetical protein JHK87_015750 [Glycine soja]
MRDTQVALTDTIYEKVRSSFFSATIWSWKSWGILPSLGRLYVSRFEKSLGIWGDLLNPTYGVNEQAIVPSGRLHQITLGVLNYSSDDM